jgi:peptide-methionine (R)-S-oxide reductase
MAGIKKFKHLSEEQKHVLLEKGTEAPGTGELLHNKEKGEYKCAACGAVLFSSKTKFDSGTGWPSFDDAVSGAIKKKEDNSLGMKRIEVICKKCGSHLGHLFDSLERKTGKRYCINSLALDFKKK